MKGRPMTAQPSAAEQAKTSALFQLMADRIPGFVWTTDTDLRVTALFGAGLAALNLQPSQVVGKTLLEYFPTDDGVPLAIAAHGQALRGESVDFEESWSGRIYRAHIERLVDEGNTVVGCIGFAQDITEQKQAEEALRQERNHARQYLDVAAVIMVALDKEGNITLLNRKGHEILEYPEGTLLGQNWFGACVPERVRNDVWSGFRQLMAGELASVEYFENPVVTRAGEERIIAWHNALLRDENGTVVGTLSSGTDITEQRQAELALRESEERYRLLSEAIPQPLWRSNANGEALEFNRRWYEYTGQTPEEAKGNGWRKALHPDDVAGVAQRVQAAVVSGGTVQVEYRLRRASDGSYRWHLARSVPMKDKDGKIIARFGSVTDIDDQKRTEEALRESEDRYRLLAEAIPQLVWRCDANGEALECNRRWYEYTGQPPEEAKGNGWMKALHPDDVARVAQWVPAHVAEGEVYQVDYRLRRAADGSYRWHLAQNLPMRDKDGKITGWFGSATDIDDRKRAEEVLKRSHDELEQRVQERTAELTKANEDLAIFRRFAEASGEGFGMSDFDGRIAYVNPTLCRLLGEKTPEDVIGKSVFTYYADEFKQRRKTELIPALLREGGWHVEQTVLPRHGKPIQTLQSTFLIRDENGNPLRIAVVISDITERKRAEEALRHSEEKYRTLVETSPDAVIMADLEGHATFVSRRTLELYGSEQIEELLERPATDFIAPEDHERLLGNLRRTKEEGITRDIEYTFVRKDGTRFPGEVSASVVRDAAGKPIGLTVLLSDVTERRQAQAALQRERRTLAHMLKASDHERQLISYEIHDGLAQYLASAIMQFQTYERLKEKQPKDAAKAFDGGMTMLKQSHFEARRLISGVRPPILDESGVVAAIAHLVHDPSQNQGPKTEFRSNVKFDRLPSVLENAIYRIVQEGLTNACNHSKSQKVRISLLQRGNRVRIQIRDWGVGFDPNKVQENRFGLAGIRERARLLGGKCRIQSNVDKGTTITVALPVVAREEDE